jgi:hypothetical protein
MIVFFVCTGFSSDTADVRIFPAKLMIGGKLEQIPGRYHIFNHEGNAYLPVRYLADKLKFIVDYDENTSTIMIEPDFKTGPKVTKDQAKLVAYEVYGFTGVQEPVLRHLTPEELKLRPDDPSDPTPVYYVAEARNAQKERSTVYVSSNSAKHHFISQSGE